MLSYDEIVDFCVKHKIGVEGFFYAFLLYLDQKMFEGDLLSKHRPKVKGASARPLAKTWEYAELSQPWNSREITRMIEKGFLIERHPDPKRSPVWAEELSKRKQGEPPRYDPSYMEVTDKFADAIMATYTRFQEFWDTYPATIPGFRNPADRVLLKITDKDKLEKTYYHKVQTKSEHESLMKALRWAIEQGSLKVSIENYLASEHWKTDLELMKDGTRAGSTWI